eukprot:jgi/Psemu1/36343/gm1.36343_g
MDNITDKHTIKYATLSPGPNSVFKRSKPASSMRSLVAPLPATVLDPTITSSNLQINTTRGQLNCTFACLVTNYIIMYTPLERNKDILGSSLSIFNFLCVPYSNKDFSQHACFVQSYEAETLHKVDVNQYTCQTTTALFVSGSQMAYSNKLNAGHTFLIFLQTLPAFLPAPAAPFPLGNDHHLFTHIFGTASYYVSYRRLFSHFNALLTPIGFQTANSAFPSLTHMVEQVAYSDHLNPFKSALSSFLWWPRHHPALWKASACLSVRYLGGPHLAMHHDVATKLPSSRFATSSPRDPQWYAKGVPWMPTSDTITTTATTPPLPSQRCTRYHNPCNPQPAFWITPTPNVSKDHRRPFDSAKHHFKPQHDRRTFARSFCWSRRLFLHPQPTSIVSLTNVLTVFSVIPAPPRTVPTISRYFNFNNSINCSAQRPAIQTAISIPFTSTAYNNDDPLVLSLVISFRPVLRLSLPHLCGSFGQSLNIHSFNATAG